MRKSVVENMIMGWRLFLNGENVTFHSACEQAVVELC